MEGLLDAKAPSHDSTSNNDTSPKRAKIWPISPTPSPTQTVAFELPELPGQEFRIVIPELLSDAEEPIVPWEQPSPKWEITENLIRGVTERPGIVRMEVSVQFQEGWQIATRVRATNLSARTWRQLIAFTCFAYYAAPVFDDPELARTYFPVEGKWRSVADLFRQHNPGDGPYTFFPVSGGPRLEDFWLCRRIPQRYPQAVTSGCGCVTSSDGKWVAGMTTPRPAFVFNNRRERCIHADPFMGEVVPGQTVEGASTIHVFRGNLEAFIALCERLKTKDE
jgi:hypothetical protein